MSSNLSKAETGGPSTEKNKKQMLGSELLKNWPNVILSLLFYSIVQNYTIRNGF